MAEFQHQLLPRVPPIAEIPHAQPGLSSGFAYAACLLVEPITVAVGCNRFAAAAKLQDALREWCVLGARVERG